MRCPLKCRILFTRLPGLSCVVDLWAFLTVAMGSNLSRDLAPTITAFASALALNLETNVLVAQYDKDKGSTRWRIQALIPDAVLCLQKRRVILTSRAHDSHVYLAFIHLSLACAERAVWGASCPVW